MSLKRRVLVCITPQSNGKRLIDRAAEEADRLSGALHILHVEKGSSLFNTATSPMLLQELFAYGSAKNGEVHGLCGEDVPTVIMRFIKRERITDVVLGSAPPESPDHLESIIAHIRTNKPNTQIIVLERAAHEEYPNEPISAARPNESVSAARPLCEPTQAVAAAT